MSGTFKFLFFLFALLYAGILSAQQHYIVYFKDKGPEKNILLSNPKFVLSPQALARRNKMNIAVSESDLPVSKVYLKLLAAKQCKVLQTSKWLNAATIESSLSAEQLQRVFPNIKEIKSWKLPTDSVKFSTYKTSKPENPELNISSNLSLNKNTTNYGLADTQTYLLGLDYLHSKGFRGDSVTIAIVDVGFQKVNTIPHFDSLNSEKRIKATHDFWGKREQVYYKHDHGTMVLSIIAANTPGQFVGTAPKANFLLAITDDLNTETHNDELNWIKALEWADSSGASIVNSSLSYSLFDPGQGDYLYSDMDGKTTIVAKGAEIAASKGMLIVVSGGNGGRLCSPCDAENVLCAGGAQKNKYYDEISSFGPTYDQRIKPDVAALTREVSFIKADGLIWKSWYGGTSSAAPQITGLAACLLQAHPNRTNLEIKKAIIQSAHNYAKPDTFTGNGIPNAKIADSILTVLDQTNGLNEINKNSSRQFSIFPNPANENIKITALNEMHLISEIELYSSLGQLIQKRNSLLAASEDLNIANHPKGIYFLHITDNHKQQSIYKVVKN